MENGKKMVTIVSVYMVLKSLLNLILGFSFSNILTLIIAILLAAAMLRKIQYSQYVTVVLLVLLFLVNLPANITNIGQNWIYLLEGILDVGAAAILVLHKDVKTYFVS